MADGNYQHQVGKRVDTGQKYIDDNGVAHIIYRKLLDVEAFPNATTKNVAHNETLDVNRWMRITNLFANNDTTGVFQGSAAGLSAEINATNVVIRATTNLSTSNGKVEIEFCLTGGAES